MTTSSPLSHTPNAPRSIHRLTGAARWIVLVLLSYFSCFGQVAWGAAETAEPVLVEKPMPRLVVQSGHSKYVAAVAFSPDGRTMASGSDDMTLRTWDAETGKPAQELGAQDSRVTAISYSPDGKLLASVTAAGRLSVWNPDATEPGERKPLDQQVYSGAVSGVAFSPDGKLIACCGEKSAKVYWAPPTPDRKAGVRVFEFTGHGGLVTCLAFSKDGKLLVNGSLSSSSAVTVAATSAASPSRAAARICRKWIPSSASG